MFISIDCNALYAIMHDYFGLYPIILLQLEKPNLKRLYAIISLSHKRRLFHLFHYDYFTYCFRNILLRFKLYMIICIIFIASYYAHYLFEMNSCDFFFRANYAYYAHYRTIIRIIFLSCYYNNYLFPMLSYALFFPDTLSALCQLWRFV